MTSIVQNEFTVVSKSKGKELKDSLLVLLEVSGSKFYEGRYQLEYMVNEEQKWGKFLDSCLVLNLRRKDKIKLRIIDLFYVDESGSTLKSEIIEPVIFKDSLILKFYSFYDITYVTFENKEFIENGEGAFRAIDDFEVNSNTFYLRNLSDSMEIPFGLKFK